jgi:hypothetical protein
VGSRALRSPAAVLISFYLIFLLAPAAAESPSLDKCTCDTQPESESNNGAWITNAAACWSTEDRGRQWCDITAESLVGSSAHAEVAFAFTQQSSDASQLTRLVVEALDRFLLSSDPGFRIAQFDATEAQALVPELLAKNAESLTACGRAFGNRGSSISGIQAGDGETFRCQVSHASGWLRLEFRLGAVWLVYMLAPNA